MNKFFKKLLGIDKIEEDAKLAHDHAAEEVKRIKEQTDQLIAETKAQLQAQTEKIEKQKVEDAATQAAILSPKEQATAQKQPYVTVLDIDLDPHAPTRGSVELDWNEYFVMHLRDNGYKGKTEEEIVDKWFTALCNAIAIDNIEENEHTGYKVKRNDLGNGLSEIG
jgi:ElaB/YqjD/DUF883 family membrane-anchored ribosome-binding protein